MTRETIGAFLCDGSKFGFPYHCLYHGRFPGRVVYSRDHISFQKRSVPECMVHAALPGLRAYGVALPLGSLGVRVQAALVMGSEMNATAASFVSGSYLRLAECTVSLRALALGSVKWLRYPKQRQD